jgi:hypothetical protein
MPGRLRRNPQGRDGKLIAANTFGKVNWASGIDKETGRPIVTEVFKGAVEGKNVTVWPSISGVTNWQPCRSVRKPECYTSTRCMSA